METNNNNYPLVSIITACYNDGPFIMECVESVQHSTYPNIEHIIVDDGSQQETLEVLKRINYPSVHIYYKANEGVCATRNLAIHKSSGKYILPLDGDDRISANYIEDAVRMFESNPIIKIVTSEISQMFDNGNGQIKVTLPLDKGLLLSRNLFTVSTMVRKEDAIAIGGFDEDFKSGLEDWNFWISIVELGGEVGVIPGTNFYYRIKKRHRNSAFGIDDVRRIHRMLWEKHKPLYSKFYADFYNTYVYQSLIAYKNYSLFEIAKIRLKERLKTTWLGRLYNNYLEKNN